MALTIGTGPFAKHPAGRFDVDPPTRPLLFWEPFPRRLRVVVGGETLTDTRAVVALHETGEMMRLCVPGADARTDKLSEGQTEHHARLGSLRTWQSEGGDKPIARQIVAPPEPARALADMVFFDLAEADAWYLEEELGYAHPRDPYHRFDVLRTSRHLRVMLGETVVAESDAPAALFETGLPVRYYLPPDAVRPGMLAKSDTVSQCPYKGDGRHWHVETGGERVEDACWSLTTPMGDALMIPRWICFYPGKLSVTIDGERVPAG